MIPAEKLRDIRQMHISGVINDIDLKFIKTLACRSSVKNARGHNVQSWLDLDLRHARIVRGDRYGRGTPVETLPSSAFSNWSNLRSIVMRTFGSGNAPQRPWVMQALREATQRGKIVINISQCMQGCVEMGRYDTGYQLQEAGVISGYDSTVESAVTKLMFLQSHYDDPEQVRHFMTQSIRGEISV